MSNVQEESLREQKKGRRRTLILEIARGLIASKGLRSLKVRDIAETADCSVGSVYNEFGDFDGVILTVNRETVLALTARLAALPKDDPIRQLHGLAAAYLDFAFLANAEVAGTAKQIVTHYYAKPAAYSYFIGCSTGGREGMILSQRYPAAFNGIVSGDPAMRTGLSNLAIAQWIPVAYNQAAPKDASGKPQIDQFLTDRERKVFMDALMKQCDAKDGVADGMISDPLGCNFDPTALSCRSGQADSCIAPAKTAAIVKAFAGPKNSYGTSVYPGFLYDAGIASKGVVPGLLGLGKNGLFGPYTTATELDVDKAALHASDPLVEPASTNLSTFSGKGGKLIFFHGDSDPWFSALDTLGYYKSLAVTNGGEEKVAEWSRIFLVPGMAHCGGGPSLDHFDMLSAVVDWVEKGTAPDSVRATGAAFPGRSRPLCAYPKHAQYTGTGDTQDARNFRCP